MGIYDKHIATLKEVKVRLPMKEEYERAENSRFICDNICLSAHAILKGSDPVAKDLLAEINKRINGEFSLEEHLAMEDELFEYRQQKRQEFLDELIAHYEQLNGEV